MGQLHGRVVVTLLASMALGLVAPNCSTLPPQGAQGGGLIGTNLLAPDYWQANLPFADVLKSAGAWHGSPSRTVFLHGIADGRYPAGDYPVTFEGQGRVKIAETWVPDSPWNPTQNHVLTIATPSEGGHLLEIAESNSSDPVRSVSVRLPGAPTGIFNPDFLASLQGNRTLRFMDWQRTNDSQPYAWSQRPRSSDERWNGSAGVPLEVMLALAQQVGAVPWLCIPHWADEAWVANFADVVAASGVEDVIVEYTNEHWNPIFEQHQALRAESESWNVDVGDFPKTSVWYAERAMAFCDVFRARLGGGVSCVLSGQAANLDVLAGQLGWLDTTGQPMPDAIAINPYVGDEAPLDAPSVSAVFDHLFDESLPGAVERIARHAGLAAEHDVELWAYEGGQHLVTRELPHVFEDAQRDARMGLVYDQLLDAWEAAGGGLFAHYADTGGWGLYGFWGEHAHLGDVNPKSEALDARR